VLHFKNKGLRCEAWDAIPLQDGVNKSLIDLLATADLTAFRIFFASGWVPTTDGKAPAADGSNLMTIAPGAFLGANNPEAKLQAIEAADLTQLLDLTQQLVMWAAMITGTPLSRFLSTRQVASADTLKEQGEPLEAKVELRQQLLGNAWEDVMRMARRLANVFGGAGLDEETSFSTLWYRKRSLDELKKKKELGVPQETIWAEMGYSPEQVEQMKQSPQYQASMAIVKMGLGDGARPGFAPSALPEGNADSSRANNEDA
jgi:hypothetical protein